MRHLVLDHTIIRFLDIGSGVPTAENVHQTAQRHHPVERHQPGTQVVYVDNDPLVIAHGRALTPASLHQRGRVEFVHADARDPASVLTDPAVVDLLVDRRPVALMLVSVLMYFDDTECTRILSTLTAALPPRSYVVISHPTDEFSPAAARAAVAAAHASGITYRPRTHEQVLRLFDGLDLDEPGVVPLTTRRPGPAPRPRPALGLLLGRRGTGSVIVLHPTNRPRCLPLTGVRFPARRDSGFIRSRLPWCLRPAGARPDQ